MRRICYFNVYFHNSLLYKDNTKYKRILKPWWALRHFFEFSKTHFYLTHKESNYGMNRYTMVSKVYFHSLFDVLNNKQNQIERFIYSKEFWNLGFSHLKHETTILFKLSRMTKQIIFYKMKCLRCFQSEKEQY